MKILADTLRSRYATEYKQRSVFSKTANEELWNQKQLKRTKTRREI